MKRRSWRKLERSKRQKETQRDEGNSGEQPGPSRVDTVEKRTHQTDEWETDTAEILDLSNVSARTSHIDNNNRQMHSIMPSPQPELIASHQGLVPIYDPIRAQMNTSNNGRNTPVYTQQMYPHPSMLQGAQGASYPHYNAIAYNQEMAMQPTTSHHPSTQFSEQHFNPTGDFAVGYRAYQTGRAQAENSDATAYNRQAMMQPATSHQPWTQFREEPFNPAGVFAVENRTYQTGQSQANNSDAIAYNQQMLSQPTTPHHVEAQLSEQHFNPTGVFAVENRAYHTGRAQAESPDITAYNHPAMTQPTTFHQPRAQLREQNFNPAGGFAVGNRAYHTGIAQMGNSDATAYNQQMLIQPTSSHQPWAQFREQHFNPAGVKAVGHRAYQTSRARAEDSDVITYSRQMLIQLSTLHHVAAQFREEHCNPSVENRAHQSGRAQAENSDVTTYNRQAMIQPTTFYQPRAQFREQHFNPAGVFAVENRTYQSGRAQAENLDATAYDQQAMMQPTTPHHVEAQLRSGSSNQLQHATNDLRYTSMHSGHYANDSFPVHQQTPALPSTSQLGQTAGNQNRGEQHAGPSKDSTVEKGLDQSDEEKSGSGTGVTVHQATNVYHVIGGTVDNRHMLPQPSTSETEQNAATRRTIDSCHEAIQRLRKILKDQIERECRGPVTEHYDDLKEPTKEVFPKLLELLRFYEGALLKMMSQYQKDPAFEYGTSSGKELDYETFLRRIIETETKRISVIAQAGSGKTVMLKRLARDLAKHNDELSIFFMNFRDFTDSEKITPCDFLINGRLPDSDAKLSYEWILENQDKVMLVLDGLDQATWDIDEKAKLVGDYSTGKVSDIVSSIFKGKLFPDVKVVYSSREHSVASLKGQLRPKMVFAMTGLSPGDAEWLFKSFVGENKEILWEKLQMQSHSLIPLLSIPAFLIFTAIVYVKKPENPPRSMTEVLKNLLEIFMRSGHIMEKDCFRVLAGLKEMSFVGMKDGKVLFYIENVRNAGLNAEQICDWIITIPGLNRCNQFLLEGEYVLMFSHQTIQEFLAAQYIIEMDCKSFEQVVMEYLMDDKWSVVTRFVSGLLFNDEIRADLTTDDVEQKRNALKFMMMGEEVGSSLELLAAVSESNHTVFIRDLVHDIDLVGSLGDSGAYVVASVMRHLVHLNQLRFEHCNLTSGNLQILCDNIKNSSLKISKLDISDNENIEDKGYATLGKIVKMCAVDQLGLEECELSDGKLKNLLSETDGTKISNLDISDNRNMEDKGYATLGKIVKMCAVDQLWLKGCELSDGKLKNLLSETDGAKISKLDVSDNILNEDTAAVLGDIVKRCSVEELTMENCGLNDGLLKTLLSRSSGAKISELDVSHNSLNEDTAAVLGDIVKRCSVEELTMHNCGLNDGSLKSLLSRCSGAKLSSIDVTNTGGLSRLNNLSSALLDEIRRSITVKRSRQ